MKKLILLICLFVSVSCGTASKYVPIEKKEVVQVRDSVVLRDSVITTFLTKERVVDVVPVYDTLKLETEYAEAISFVDTTTHNLKGELTQKSDVPVTTKILYRDRIITKDRIVKQEIPVEVKVETPVVPKFFWISLIFNILFVIFIVIKVKSKFF